MISISTTKGLNGADMKIICSIKAISHVSQDTCKNRTVKSLGTSLSRYSYGSAKDACNEIDL